MALSFAELARCVSTSVTNQLRIFARARTQQSCKPQCKHIPQKMLVRDLTFLGKGSHRYISHQHSLQLIDRFILNLPIDRYILNLPNTNIHKNQAGTKYLGSKSGSYRKMPPLTTSQLKRTRGLSRAASSTDITVVTAHGKKMGLHRHKLRFSSVAARRLDFRLLKNIRQFDKDNKSDKLRNGSSGFIKNEIEFESQIQRNKTQANQAFIERCAKAAGMKEPLRFGRKKEPSIKPSLKGSSQEPTSQQRVTSPFFNLTKEMGDWLNAVCKHPTKVKKGDSKNSYRDRREIRSLTGNIQLPNSLRKAYTSQSASNLSTEKMINAIRNDFKSLKQRNTEGKTQQTTQKKARKDFGTIKNIEKINNEINRLRRDKFIERGAMKQMPDRSSGKPKERGEILEIRPTYVENFPPGGTTRKKVSSSQSFAALNVHALITLPGKSAKEVHQDKQSVNFSKNTQKLKKARSRSVPDIKYPAMSNKKGSVLVDSHAENGQQAAFLRNFPEDISRNASLSQNAEVSSKIRFSDIKGGNCENKSFILLDDDAASTHMAKLNQELLNEELAKQKRFTKSSHMDKLANEELTKQNGFILADADKIQSSTLKDFETSPQEKGHVQPKIAERVPKKEQKNVVLDNDNPHLNLRITVKPQSESRSQFVSANKDNKLNDDASGKFPVATNTVPSFTFRDRKQESIITRVPTKDYNQSAGTSTSSEDAQNIKNHRKEGDKRFSLLVTAGETTELQHDFLSAKNELRKWSQMLERRLKEIRSKAFGRTNDKYSSEMKVKPSNSKTSPYKIKDTKSAQDVRENVKKTTLSANAEARTRKKKIASQISQTQVSATDFIARRLPKLLTRKSAPKSGDSVKEPEVKPKQKHQAASSEPSLDYPSSNVFMLKSKKLSQAEVNELRPDVRKKRDKSLLFNSKLSPEPQLTVKPEELSKKLKQTSSGPCTDAGTLKPQTTSQSISLGRLTPTEDLIKKLQLHLKSSQPDTEKKSPKLHIYKQNFEKFASADVKKDSTKSIQPQVKYSNMYLLDTMKTTPTSSTGKSVPSIDPQEWSNKKINKPLKKKAAATTLSDMLLKPSSIARKKVKSTSAQSTSYRRNKAVMQELREQWSKDFNEKLQKYKLDFYSSDFQKNDNCLVGSPNDAKTLPGTPGQAGNEVNTKANSPQMPNKFYRKSDHLPTMGMAERLLAAAKKPSSCLDRDTTYDLMNSDSSMTTFTDATITPWTLEMEDLEEVDQFKEWIQSDLPESYKNVEPKSSPSLTGRLEATTKLFNLTRKTQDNTKPAAEPHSSCVDAGSSIDGPYYPRPAGKKPIPTDCSFVSTDPSTFHSLASRNLDEFYDYQEDIPSSLLAVTSNKAKDNYKPVSQASISNTTEATAVTDPMSYMDTLTHSSYPKYSWDVGTMSTIIDSSIGPKRQEKNSQRGLEATTTGIASKINSPTPANSPKISKVLGSLDGVASLTVISETPEPHGKALKSTLKRSRSREEKRVSFKALATANNKSKTQDTNGLNQAATIAADKNLGGMSPPGSNLRKELTEQRVKDEKEARIKLIKSYTKQIREYERVLSKYRDQVAKNITAKTD